MKQRGRKSVANVTAINGEIQRPEPPDSLSAAQAATWHQITQCLPPDYFSADIQPLLLSYVKHIDYAAAIDRELDAFEPEWLKSDDGLKRYNQLLALRERQTSNMLSLARSLRLTNQSRYTPQRAATVVSKGHSSSSPWEQ